MALAESVADLVSADLRYTNGDPVQCVVADTTIGRVAEAAAAEAKFAANNVGLTITVTPAWCYGSETMDSHPTRPKAVWGFNGTERPGAVYLAAVLAAHTQKGLPAIGIYGRDVQDADDGTIPDDVTAKILQFVRAGLAVATMRGNSYLSIGGTSMGIAGSIVDHGFFEHYLGMRVEAIDMTEVLRRVERDIFDGDEYVRAREWVRTNCTEGFDPNPDDKQRSRAQLDEEWDTSIKMALIVRDLMTGNGSLATRGFGEEALGHNAIAAGFQGQRQWTDHQPNGDFMEAILNTSFDWDGTRAPYVVATENDALNGASMLLAYLLTNRAQIFADVRTYWSPDAVKRVTGHQLEGAAAGGFLHLINSGPAALDATGAATSDDGAPTMKPFWEINEEDIDACLSATTWHPSVTEYFPGGGWSTRFTTRGGMPVTMCRINMVHGLGPVLQIAEGWTVELPDDVHDALDQRTNPTWPTTWFVPRLTEVAPFNDVYSVMNAWGANHGAISEGHIGSDLITLASLLRIPVYMHNVDQELILRPSAWNGFGTADSESADFRACAAYGPLY
jgi:L-fucose isomerase